MDQPSLLPLPSVNRDQEVAKRITKTQGNKKISPILSLVAGGVAGGVEATITVSGMHCWGVSKGTADKRDSILPNSSKRECNLDPMVHYKVSSAHVNRSSKMKE